MLTDTALKNLKPKPALYKVTDRGRAVSDGKSPAQERQREKRRLSEAKNFQEFTDRWAKGARMADSTRISMGQSSASV